MLDERAYWVAWSRIPQLGGRRLLSLHEAFGSLAAAWEARAWRLAALPGWGPKLAGMAVEARSGLDPAREWEAVTGSPARPLTWLDADYPPPLREIADPPPVLYAWGRLPEWERAIAIVGNRSASPYGARVARELACQFAELGGVVVSGLAAGIDRYAHEGALAAREGLTVGVLGCGFQHVYPASNRDLYRQIAERGCLLSEYPPEVRPMKGHFPYRNRIISGLCRGVVVVEASRSSGSLITAHHALEQNREVFAVPGPIQAPGSAGPHELIRAGAHLLSGLPDLLGELGWTPRPATSPALEPLERRVLEVLGAQPITLDALAGALGLGGPELACTLLTMELKGLLRALPGGRYGRG